MGLSFSTLCVIWGFADPASWVVLERIGVEVASQDWGSLLDGIEVYVDFLVSLLKFVIVLFKGQAVAVP